MNIQTVTKKAQIIITISLLMLVTYSHSVQVAAFLIVGFDVSVRKRAGILYAMYRTFRIVAHV